MESRGVIAENRSAQNKKAPPGTTFWAIKLVGEFDRRFRTVELTEAGRDLVPRFARFVDNTDREIFGNLKRRRRLLRTLKRVVHTRRQKERVDIWHAPRSMASGKITERGGHERQPCRPNRG